MSYHLGTTGDKDLRFFPGQVVRFFFAPSRVTPQNKPRILQQLGIALEGTGAFASPEFIGDADGAESGMVKVVVPLKAELSVDQLKQRVEQALSIAERVLGGKFLALRQIQQPMFIVGRDGTQANVSREWGKVKPPEPGSATAPATSPAASGAASAPSATRITEGFWTRKIGGVVPVWGAAAAGGAVVVLGLAFVIMGKRKP